MASSFVRTAAIITTATIVTARRLHPASRSEGLYSSNVALAS